MILLWTLGLLALLAGGYRWHLRSSFHIPDSPLPLSQRKALVILVGAAGLIHGGSVVTRAYAGRGYDVFTPFLFDRRSLGGYVRNLDKFLRRYRLSEYGEMNFFSYLGPSWVLNAYLESRPDLRVNAIVYDRSPLQERGGWLLTQCMRWTLLLAPVTHEFVTTVYHALPTQNAKIGLLIENKASSLLVYFKDKALSKGPVLWEVEAFGQPCHDHMYTWHDHDDMYRRLGSVVGEVLHFCERGRFTAAARRQPFERDPFERIEADA